MANRISLYPPEWAQEIIGQTSPALNDALSAYAVALLVAAQENEDLFTTRQWSALHEALHGATFNTYLSDLPDIVARHVLCSFPPGDDRAGMSREIAHFAYFQVIALLAVCRECKDASQEGWYTKESFLAARKKASKGRVRRKSGETHPKPDHGDDSGSPLTGEAD